MLSLIHIWPSVPIVFGETRTLAEEWTYRYLAAGLAELTQQAAADDVDLPTAGPLPKAEPTTREVRTWARAQGLSVPDRGRLRPEVWQAYRAAQEGVS